MTLLDSIVLNLASPPIVFFALGVLSVLLRTDLRLPEPVYTTLATYLLMAIGFKGGVALAEAAPVKYGYLRWRPWSWGCAYPFGVMPSCGGCSGSARWMLRPLAPTMAR